MKKVIIVLFMCLLLVGCEFDELEGNNTIVSEYGLKSDDTKKVYTDGSNYHVFYYEKEKITEYEIWNCYDTDLEATYLYEDLKNNTSGDVESVLLNGKCIVNKYIKEYVESEFKNIKVSDLKSEFSYLTEVK